MALTNRERQARFRDKQKRTIEILSAFLPRYQRVVDEPWNLPLVYEIDGDRITGTFTVSINLQTGNPEQTRRDIQSAMKWAILGGAGIL